MRVVLLRELFHVSERPQSIDFLVVKARSSDVLYRVANIRTNFIFFWDLVIKQGPRFIDVPAIASPKGFRTRLAVKRRQLEGALSHHSVEGSILKVDTNFVSDVTVQQPFGKPLFAAHDRAKGRPLVCSGIARPAPSRIVGRMST